MVARRNLVTLIFVLAAMSAMAAPSGLMNSTTSDPTTATSITVTLAFDVPVSGLSLLDFVTTNSRINTLTGSGTSYQLTLYPKAPGEVRLVLPAGTVQDTTGSFNEMAATFSRTFTGWAPLSGYYDLSAGNGDMILYGGRAEDYMASFSAHGGITVGDINGDGIADLLIGSTGGDGPNDTRVDCGEAAVVFGRMDNPAVMDAAGEVGPKPDLIIHGADNGDHMCENGPILAADLNNDGYDDMIIGAINADGPGNARPDCGEIYIIFGRDDFTSATLDIAAGQQNVTIYAASAGAWLGNFGDAMHAGDVNGDGYKDLVIGSYFENITYVIYGRASWPATIDLAAGQQSVTIQGGYWPTAYGTLALGDFNGDSIADIAIGEPKSDGATEYSGSGRVYVILGSAALPSAINCPGGGANMIVYGALSSETLSSAGIKLADFDQDGKDDLILGGSGSGYPAGRVYVIYGRAAVPASIDLAQNQQDLLILGAHSPDGLWFFDAMPLGDLNGDGRRDLVVNAPFARGPNNDHIGVGEIDLIFGGVTRRTGTINLASHQEDAIIYGSGGNLYSYEIGDFNHDGIDDLVCAEAGRKTYILSGKPQWPVSMDLATSSPEVTIWDSDFYSVQKAGDFNGDLVDDLAIGERDAEGPGGTRGTSTGEVNWILGVSKTPPAPEIEVYLGTALIPHNGGPVDYGRTAVGAAALSKTYLVKNNGILPLHISNVIVPNGYVITEPLAAIIPPESSDTFTVALTTSTAGEFVGNIGIESNDSERNPYMFTVCGTIGMPDVSVLNGTTPIVNGAGPIDFGVGAQNIAGPTITFTVRNSGNGTLTTSNLNASDGFVVTEGLSASIAPGGSDTFTVRLLTAAVGVVTGNISFTNNVNDKSPYLFSVTGRVMPQPFTPQRRAKLWTTDGTVSNIVTSGTTTFISGGFQYVGPYTGGGAVLDPATGQLDPSFPTFDGTVHASAPDGADGFYVGGSFTSVNGAASQCLVHILANGSVDPNFNPNPNGAVKDIVISGSTLYVAGAFTSIGGQTRSRVAALNPITGTATTWNPNASAEVHQLVPTDTTVYAVGSFVTIGGQTRNCLAELDRNTGLATAFNPNPNNAVSRIALSGGLVYAAGYFTNIGGQARNMIAALDSIGAATAWNPNINNGLLDLCVLGSTVYVAGPYMTVGGQAHNYAAGIDISTGLLTGWNPAPNNWCERIAAIDSKIYIAGSFTTIGGQSRRKLACLDPVTGAAMAWNPGINDDVYTYSQSGSKLFIGGVFFTTGGASRNYLAAIDDTTGAVLAWDPNPSHSVGAMCKVGSLLYLGGGFTSVGGQTRSRLAAVDVGTGLANAWNPGANYAVNCMSVSGSTLYVGGLFTTVAGQSRGKIASFNLSTGAITSWNPNADYSVNKVAASGSTVYVCGNFNNIGGQARNGLAALNASTGLATGWNPNPNSTVHTIEAASPLLYVGGYFTTIGGAARQGIAAIDMATGTASSWKANANGYVNDILILGDTVYLGGAFTQVDGQPRNNLASVDIATGWATPWNPTSAVVTCLSSNPTSLLVGTETVPFYLMQFKFPPVAPTDPAAAVNSSSQVTWSWTDHANDEEGFNVWVDAGPYDPTTLRTTTPPDAQSWTQSGLLNNTQYSMQVASAHGDWPSPRTTAIHAWTLAERISALDCVCGTHQIQVTAANPPNNISVGSSGIYFETSAGGADSGWKQDTSAWILDGLSPNRQYVISGRSRNAEGTETTPTSTTVWTLAARPAAPILTQRTCRSVRVTLAGDDNPSPTSYCIRISPPLGSGQWIQADGNAGTAPAWLTAATWGTVLINDLAPAGIYQFYVSARNSAGVNSQESIPSGITTLDAIWVQFNCSGNHDGSSTHPFAFLIDALAAAGDRDTIRIRGDAGRNWTTETPRITTKVRIEAVGGPIRIGAD